MNIEELITTYERRAKNLQNECNMNEGEAKRLSCLQLMTVRQTLNELNSLRLDFVSNRNMTRTNPFNVIIDLKLEGDYIQQDSCVELMKEFAKREIIALKQGQNLPISGVVESFSTLVTTLDDKQHRVLVPIEYDATQTLDYLDGIFGANKWKSWSRK